VENRTQYVSFNNAESNTLLTNVGVPQGSILGPLFFSLFINDFPGATSIFKSIMYADDTTLYCNLEDFNEVDIQLQINNELNNINLWLSVNKLTLNVDKCKFMIFKKHSTHNTHLSLHIDQRCVQQCHSFNFLGLMITDNLTWKKHTEMIGSKISKVIGIIYRLRYFYPQRILLSIYNALIVPHFNYCLLSWGKSINSIEKLQKRAIRTMSFSNKMSHTEPIYKALELIKVTDLYQAKVLKFY
jgi:hypothetical protein